MSLELFGSSVKGAKVSDFECFKSLRNESLTAGLVRAKSE